ncbi:MAG TPA: MCP four helix bundle domain-containing protein, partial [Deltaproteobacteria bacterium]|nr:MCP four helix bundle domain-containing protein [Deltaproteobacteria bacterium]
MASIKKIIIGFGIIIVLLTIMGVVAVVTTVRMTTTSQRIYAHPFAVSNATKDISIHFLSIQRDMKNILLLEDSKQMDILIDRINEHDTCAAEDFEILFDRFLGDLKDVQRLYDTFIKWESLRKEIISRINEGKKKEAIRISATESQRYADSLTESTQQLIDFATEKADQLQEDARREQRISITVIVILLSIIVLVSLIIVTHVIGTFRKDQKELARHLYLVDQNVLICSLD